MEKAEVLRVRAILDNVRLAIECVSKTARAAGIDDETLYKIQLAVDEACANVVNHAYRGMDPGDMEVSCFHDERAFSVCVRDWGRSFAPEAVPEPDVEAPLEERTLGGLGMFLMKQVMDQVHYRFDPEQGNELKMTKRLQVAE
jgi:serine/threonine-protein kinase RsbW